MKTNKNSNNMLKISLLILGMAIIFSFGVSSVAAANNNTVYVNTHGNDSWDGLSAIYNSTSGSGPKATIRNATSTVADNGTIHIASGTYTGQNNIMTNIDKNIIIIGENQQNTIIKGEGQPSSSSSTLFFIASGINVTIINLTLSDGYNMVGGAICNQGTLTVINCTLNNNSAGAGGAIYNHGTLTVNNSTFTGNTAGSGGAIYNDYNSLTVNSSTFTGNTAGSGGAIYNGYGATLTVTSSTFNSNTAQQSEGGAISNCGSLNVSGSIFDNNTAPDDEGGAIYDGGPLTVNNCTFTNNTATYGGAIFNLGYEGMGTININFCWITSNTGTDIYNVVGSLHAEDNWWGSNFQGTNPGSAGRVNASVNIWIILTIKANTSTVLNGGSSTVTVDLQHDNQGQYHDPSNGHVPDSIPVTLTGTLGNLDPIPSTLLNGQVTSIFTANHAGTASITATVDSQTVSAPITINPSAYLYLNYTVSKNNPTTGKTFTITYKLSNNGPDNANNVTVSFQIPEGLEFIGASVDGGNWTYNLTNRTITWTLDNVAVGDPYLYLRVKPLNAGSFTINPTITSTTFNQNTQKIPSLIINAVNNGSGSNTISSNSSGVTVKAVSNITKTIGMQDTGLPLAGLVLAVLAIFGGLIPKRK